MESDGPRCFSQAIEANLSTPHPEREALSQWGCQYVAQLPCCPAVSLTYPGATQVSVGLDPDTSIVLGR